MEIFFKTVGAVLVGIVLILALEKQSAAMLLTVAVSVMAATAAISFLTPLKSLFQQLQSLADIQTELMGTLLKCTGISLVSELAAFICQDAGLGSLKKTVQFLGNCVTLCLSVPAIQALLTLLKDMLSEL